MFRRAGHWTPIAIASGFVALAALSAAPADAEDYPACAKIENPLAYNQCLATHGPTAHETRAIAPPRGRADGPRDASQGRFRSSMQFSRARNGRMMAEFSVGSAPTPARSHKPKKTP
jgi:hypothetical protein